MILRILRNIRFYERKRDESHWDIKEYTFGLWVTKTSKRKLDVSENFRLHSSQNNVRSLSSMRVVLWQPRIHVLPCKTTQIQCKHTADYSCKYLHMQILHRAIHDWRLCASEIAVRRNPRIFHIFRHRRRLTCPPPRRRLVCLFSRCFPCKSWSGASNHVVECLGAAVGSSAGYC